MIIGVCKARWFSEMSGNFKTVLLSGSTMFRCGCLLNSGLNCGKTAFEPRLRVRPEPKARPGATERLLGVGGA